MLELRRKAKRTRNKAPVLMDAEQVEPAGRRPGSPPPQRAEHMLPQRLLSTCTKKPITMTEVGVHISSLKGAAAKYNARLQLFQDLQRLVLGEVKPTRRRPEFGRRRLQNKHLLSLERHVADPLLTARTATRSRPRQSRLKARLQPKKRSWSTTKTGRAAW